MSNLTETVERLAKETQKLKDIALLEQCLKEGKTLKQAITELKRT